jgi:hypothetical protein
VFPTVNSLSSVASIQFVGVTEEVLVTPSSIFVTYAPSSQPSAQPTSVPTKEKSKSSYTYRYPIFVVFVTLAVAVLGLCCVGLLYYYLLSAGMIRKSDTDDALDGSKIVLEPVGDMR